MPPIAILKKTAPYSPPILIGCIDRKATDFYSNRLFKLREIAHKNRISLLIFSKMEWSSYNDKDTIILYDATNRQNVVVGLDNKLLLDKISKQFN